MRSYSVIILTAIAAGLLANAAPVLKRHDGQPAYSGASGYVYFLSLSFFVLLLSFLNIRPLTLTYPSLQSFSRRQHRSLRSQE